MEFYNISVSSEAIKLATEVLQSGWLNEGKYVLEFEQKLAEFGLLNPLTVNSCTSALHLALSCSGVNPGDEVILSPQTFVATGIAVLMCGAKPVFVDIDLENGGINPEKIEEKITEKTKAVIVVHWGGNVCKIGEVCRIAKGKNLKVIEDAAHAFGSIYKDTMIGGNEFKDYTPDFTCFSFQTIKMLTTGDGGAICTSNQNMVEKIKRKRWFGLDKNTPRRSEGDRNCLIKELGFKYNMNNINAALGIGNLTTIKEKLIKRRLNAFFYEREFEKTPGVALLKTPNATSSYWLFTLRVKNRAELLRKLKEKEIPASVVDRRIDEHPIFGGVTDGLINQEIFDQEQISIPVHEALTEEDKELIVKTINEGW